MDTIASLPTGLTTADLPADMQASGRAPLPLVRLRTPIEVPVPHEPCEHGWRECGECSAMSATR